MVDDRDGWEWHAPEWCGHVVVRWDDEGFHGLDVPLLPEGWDLDRWTQEEKRAALGGLSPLLAPYEQPTWSPDYIALQVCVAYGQHIAVPPVVVNVEREIEQGCPVLATAMFSSRPRETMAELEGMACRLRDGFHQLEQLRPAATTGGPARRTERGRCSEPSEELLNPRTAQCSCASTAHTHCPYCNVINYEHCEHQIGSFDVDGTFYGKLPCRPEPGAYDVPDDSTMDAAFGRLAPIAEQWLSSGENDAFEAMVKLLSTPVATLQWFHEGGLGGDSWGTDYYSPRPGEAHAELLLLCTQLEAGLKSLGCEVTERCDE
jgi:hypothetical protein